MIRLTDEQRAAIEVGGKAIVSASAGSGKTFVMIEKLVAAIADGADLDNVLAVTFTKKAAAQMKEKLRSAVIARMAESDAETRTRLKIQLSKISGANISTIHAFCARLLRTYFYCAGIDGSFDIISADDAQAKEYKRRALDNLFEKYYAEENEHFLRLLSCYRKKRSDNSLRALILEGYEKLRISARYTAFLDGVSGLYTEQGFERVCAEYSAHINEKLAALKSAVISFAEKFVNSKKQVYDKIFGEMISALDGAAKGGIFSPMPPLTVTKKPVDGAADKESGAEFKAFKDALSKSYKSIRGDTADEETERQSFFESGRTAVAFAQVLKDFDEEYTQIKREEN
ncbi:MAG: UvrD-helicase domain-containing protein, partial [Clostridia bacterium]|nr:UvrD-helicase domain-containing protein [Clostridia bacterium]